MSNDNYGQPPQPDPRSWGGEPTVQPPWPGASSGPSGAEPPYPANPAFPAGPLAGEQNPGGYQQQGYPPAPEQQVYPPQHGYAPEPPAYAPQHGYPGVPEQQGYAPEQGYPGVPEQQGYAPEQGYPGVPEQQGYAPGQFDGYATSGYPSAPAGGAAYGQAPPPAFPVNSGNFGYQPGAGGYPGVPQQTPKRKSSRAALVAIPLAVVLVAGVIYLATRPRSQPAAVSTPPGPSASSSASQTSDDGPAPTAKAPGPGTTTTVLAYLESKGFTCTDEGVKAIVSKYCTHFDASPAMSAYVGGRTDGSLGRLSLNVQDNPDAKTKATSTWVIQQFMGDEADSSAIAADIATGTDKDWVSGTQGDVQYRGEKDGSVVLFVDDWYPADLVPQVIETSVSDLSQYVISKGYTCGAGSSKSALTCTRKANGNDFTVYMHEDDSGEHIVSAAVTVVRPSPSPELAAVVKSETTMLLNGMGAQAAPWKAYIYDADGDAGDAQFVAGMLADWYPAGLSKSTTGGLSLLPSCRSDEVKRC